MKATDRTVGAVSEFAAKWCPAGNVRAFLADLTIAISTAVKESTDYIVKGPGSGVAPAAPKEVV